MKGANMKNRWLYHIYINLTCTYVMQWNLLKRRYSLNSTNNYYMICNKIAWCNQWRLFKQWHNSTRVIVRTSMYASLTYKMRNFYSFLLKNLLKNHF